jgi:hypothetical protein
MYRAAWTFCFFFFVAAPGSVVSAADKPDALAEARTLYNQRQFEAAVSAAERARLTPGLADRADLIAARAYLERYRESATADDLVNARARLRRLDPLLFNLRERAEFIVGLGEALYFEESFGAAAEVFETVLDGPDGLTVDSRERVLDWWANAVDRDASRSEAGRQAAHQRIQARMREELTDHPNSATAPYWLAAAARALGDLQAAWDAAEAGWVRASLSIDRGAALRADLDRLMLVAIVPERARELSEPEDTVRLDWDRFKERWAVDESTEGEGR